jgi:hypothetical protein
LDSELHPGTPCQHPFYERLNELLAKHDFDRFVEAVKCGFRCLKFQSQIKPMKYGYACVSTADQNPALQMDALKKAKCDCVFQEKCTGATRKRRPYRVASRNSNPATRS